MESDDSFFAQIDRFQRSKINFKINPFAWRDDKAKLADYLKDRSQVYMHLLGTKAISEDQMKVEFSIDILTTIFGSEDFSQLNMVEGINYIKDMQNLLKENLEYLKILYPRNKRTEVATQLTTEIKDCDYLDKAEYDIMAQTKTLFEYKDESKDSGTQILDQIRTFINKIIQSSREDFDLFKKVLKVKILEKIPQKQRPDLQQIFNDGHKFKFGMKIPDDHLLLQDFGSQRFKIQTTQMFRLIIKWIEDLAKIVQKKQQTIAQRKYFKKFKHVYSEKEQLSLNMLPPNPFEQQQKRQQSQEIQKLTSIADLNHNRRKSKLAKTEKKMEEKKQEIQEESFFSSIFKNITNFCTSDVPQVQQLPTNKVIEETKNVINTLKFIPKQIFGKNIEFSSFRYNVQGNPINYYLDAMADLNPNNEAQKFVNKQLEQLQANYIEIMKIVQNNKITQNFSLVEKKIYSFSQHTYQFLREMAVDRLANLIQMLVNFRYSSMKKIGVKGAIFKDCDLVSFKVTDMLRARIMVNQKQILLIFNALQQLHQQNEIHLVKVKNRFNEAMNDAIIIFQIRQKSRFDSNVFYSSPILCQYQLILSKASHQTTESSKQKASETLNHYLYELQRSTYGPLSELALIIATKDHRIDYLKKIKKKNPKQKIILENMCFCKQGKISEQSKKKYENLEYVEYFFDKKGIATGMSFKKWKNSLPRPFICSICQKVYGKVQNLFPIKVCQNCRFHVCSECQFATDSGAERMRYRKALQAIVCSVWEDEAEVEHNFEKQKSEKEQSQKDQSQQNDVPKGERKKIEYKFDLRKNQMNDKSIVIGLKEKFIRFKIGDSKKKFWNSIRQQFEKKVSQQQYENDKQLIGILLKPALVFSSESIPFQVIVYEKSTKKILKYYIEQMDEEQIDEKNIIEEYDQQIQCKPFDAFFFFSMNDDDAYEDDILSLYVETLKNLNPFLRRRKQQNKNFDHQIKIKKNLEKMVNIYDDELNLNDLFIQEIDFFPFNELYGPKIKKIKFLNLSGNQITSLRGLQLLESLQDLRLQRNQISEFEIKDEAFPKLKSFYISQNQAKHLVLSNHKKLEILQAQKNNFKLIQISNLPNLQILHLSGEYESKLTFFKIEKIPKLTVFKWQNIQVYKDNLRFPGEDYPNLTDLTFLSTNWLIGQFPPKLQFCKLRRIFNVNLQNLNCLKYLQLEQIHLQKFIFPPKCVKLVMNLSSFDDPQGLPFVSGKCLKQLKLSLPSGSYRCIQISNFLKSDLPNLESLSFQHIGQLQQNDSSNFSNFKSLKSLQIKNCLQQVNSLPKNLQSLIIQSRADGFKLNPSIMDDLKHLSVLEIDGISLQSIKPSQKARKYSVSSIAFKQLFKCSCEDLKTIQIVNAENFQKRGLEQSYFPNLQILQIQDTKIIDLCFNYKLKNLKTLQLRYNKIVSMLWIPGEKLESLKQLNLQQNQIANLQLFESSTLQSIIINGNPLLNLKEDAEKLALNKNNLVCLLKRLQVFTIFPVRRQKEYLYPYSYGVDNIVELFTMHFSLIDQI